MRLVDIVIIALVVIAGAIKLLDLYLKLNAPHN